MRVLATGTFDKLHEGHKYFLQTARNLGDELHVIIARDSTVQKIKGKSPVNNEIHRTEEISKLPFVDRAYLGDLKDPYSLVINNIKPDIIALGYDQVAFTDNLATILENKGLQNTKIVRVESYMPHKYKSSKI